MFGYVPSGQDMKKILPNICCFMQKIEFFMAINRLIVFVRMCADAQLLHTNAVEDISLDNSRRIH